MVSSADTISQAGRRLSVETPLGKDAFVLTAVEGEERISSLFTYRLEMASAKESIAPETLLGKPVTFRVARVDGKERCFNGIVSRFAAGPMLSRSYRRYYAEVVPWLWFLTRTTDCRIFQEKTVPQIVELIFTEGRFTDFEITGIQGSHPTRDYCVQYRETDFNFVSRLMEEEGIFFFFRHESGKHTLVLADQRAAYTDCAEHKVEYRTNPDVHAHISHWRPSFGFRSGKWTQRDYNFETPSTDLTTSSKTLLKTQRADAFEFFDYPGLYSAKEDGKTLTELRMEEEEAAHAVAEGQSDCASFTPGGKFTLIKHDCEDEEGKSYVITGVRHSASDHTHFAGQGGPPHYENTFTCIPDQVPYRPPRETPRPVVRGPQTAFVVGPADEEIFCDKYGRVKVQFHWDRVGKTDDHSSCWIRVAQAWAGRKWGGMFIPRIGMEVLVEFLEGDPDRPIIVGCVYNAEQMPPYDLPANKTQSGIKTRSSLDGGESNFNELRFEDKKDAEEIYFHAEKNFNRVVENNDTLKVGFEKKDKGDQTIEIFNNQTVTIGGGGSNASDGSQTVTVYKDRKHTIQTGNDELTVEKGNRSTTISQGNDTLTISQGNHEITISAGKSVITAAQSIELKVGQNSIKIDQTGITLNAMMIKIEGTTRVEMKGLMTQVDGTAMLTLKGGVMMLN